jgi:hypothetical protein
MVVFFLMIVAVLLAGWGLPAGYCCVMGADRLCFGRRGPRKELAVFITLLIVAIATTFVAYRLWIHLSQPLQ